MKKKSKKIKNRIMKNKINIFYIQNIKRCDKLLSKMQNKNSLK
jgi:hypothetical protein